MMIPLKNLIIELYKCTKPQLMNGFSTFNDNKKCKSKKLDWLKIQGDPDDDGIRYKIDCSITYECNTTHAFKAGANIMGTCTDDGWGDPPICEESKSI